MKKYFSILAVILIFSASCGSNGAATVKTQTLKLDKEGFKDCPIEIDIPDKWHLNSVEGMKYTAHISADMGLEGGIIITPQEAAKCTNFDFREATVIEDIKLKNGFGVRYMQPLPGGKEQYKYFIVIIQVRGKCFMVENNDFDDRQNAKWDIEKEMIETIR